MAKPRGYIGMITANSFMKREFGSKLIKDYLPTVNLETLSILPAHTFQVMGPRLCCCLEPPKTSKSDGADRACKSRRTEHPDDPERGLVWSSNRQPLERRRVRQ